MPDLQENRLKQAILEAIPEALFTQDIAITLSGNEITVTANGYTHTLQKPFRIGTLFDLLQTRYNKSKQEQRYQLGPWLYVKSTQSIEQEGAHAVYLTDKEADILNYFIDKKAQNVSKETLLEAVWGYRSDLETHTVETHIYRLRQKIEQNPNNPLIFVTDKDGYNLTYQIL